jgi:integrase
MTKVPTCPQCGSTRTWKDGTRQTENGKTQRYYCRECCYRFSETNSNHSNELRTVQTFHRLPLNTPSTLLFDRQICASQATETKNLVKVETRTETRLAGATKLSKSELKGKIIEFLWWMKKEGYKESTIFSRGQRLKRFVNLNANLYHPEHIKEIIATQDTWSDARKEGMVYTYDLFAQWAGLNWIKPHYKPIRKLPFIPQEREIDDLIAGSNKQISAFLQIGKETGARAGEIFNLTWFDIDLQNKTINITPEKGSNPRILKISNRLIGMLSSFLNKETQIFTNYKSLKTLRRTFQRYRQRTAHKLGNPRIQKITFHTLRHWKATTEYHQTKDILHVMKLLGHRNIKNTLLYTQLIKQEENEEYISKVAQTIDEGRILIEAGFEYVCEIQGAKLFRKHK